METTKCSSYDATSYMEQEKVQSIEDARHVFKLANFE
jgi:hypothetical protein